MLEFLPKEVLEGLEGARKREQRKKSRLRVRVEDEVFPILRMWENGFCVARGTAKQLRGLVDVYDGSRHLYQALIVASHDDEFEINYDFKRSTSAVNGQPLDYDRPDDAPVALLAQL